MIQIKNSLWKENGASKSLSVFNKWKHESNWLMWLANFQIIIVNICSSIVKPESTNYFMLEADNQLLSWKEKKKKKIWKTAPTNHWIFAKNISNKPLCIFSLHLATLEPLFHPLKLKRFCFSKTKLATMVKYY